MASRHIVTVVKDSKIAVVRTIQRHGENTPNRSLFSNTDKQVIHLA